MGYKNSLAWVFTSHEFNLWEFCVLLALVPGYSANWVCGVFIEWTTIENAKKTKQNKRFEELKTPMLLGDEMDIKDSYDFVCL